MGKKLLIVDDDQDLLRQLDFLLEDDFEKSYVAASVDEAISMPLKDIDVFLIDVRLSETDPKNTEGLKLVKEIRNKKDSAVIIMMSRYDAEKYEKLAKEEAGADGFIRKPFTMDELVEMTQKIEREKKC